MILILFWQQKHLRHVLYLNLLTVFLGVFFTSIKRTLRVSEGCDLTRMKNCVEVKAIHIKNCEIKEIFFKPPSRKTLIMFLLPIEFCNTGWQSWNLNVSQPLNQLNHVICLLKSKRKKRRCSIWKRCVSTNLSKEISVSLIKICHFMFPSFIPMSQITLQIWL